jgi:NDP-sugar pyrophosphorylase family protein
VEAIILAGGKAERLGDAAGGRPKSLVDVAGKPLAAYQVGRLARAGVTRVIFACAAGQGDLFVSELSDIGPEIVAVEERERLGRGGGIRFAAQRRRETGDVLALNGDELVDVDFAALLEAHRAGGALATIAVARPKSQFGLVDVGDDDLVRGFEEACSRRKRSRASRRRATTSRRRFPSSRRRGAFAPTATTGSG